MVKLKIKNLEKYLSLKFIKLLVIDIFVIFFHYLYQLTNNIDSWNFTVFIINDKNFNYKVWSINGLMTYLCGVTMK